jgi:ribokinase
MSSGARIRIGVIGHVEHVTLGRVTAVPRAGEIAHLEDPIVFPGGGGGVAFFQLAKSDAELHLFTAIGNDDAGRSVEAGLRQTQANLHLARREEPHTRDVVMIDPKGDRTIVVVGEPLHPRATDPLPWEILSDLDAVYFTAQDPDLLTLAREAGLLLATARRRPSIILSGVRCDVVIGSRSDARESSTLSDYPVPPSALVMTEGKRGGSIESEQGVARFAAPSLAAITGGSYGAGDSFAGALTYFVASGLTVVEAASRAAQYGAAVLEGLDPLQSQRTL